MKTFFEWFLRIVKWFFGVKVQRTKAGPLRAKARVVESRSLPHIFHRYKTTRLAYHAGQFTPLRPFSKRVQ